MMEIAAILTIYLILNTIIWLLRHFSLTQAKRQAEVLDSSYRKDMKHWPKVSVLVAARNEEKNIARCLKYLLEQDYPDFEIIAIDDRSEDGTGEIVDKLAEEHKDKLKVIHIENLPENWLGKPNAMYEGAKYAQGEYLLFTDADCFFYCPSVIRIAVSYTIDNNLDLLSVLPVLETHTVWEKILQPVCSAVLMIWFRPHRVNDPESKIAYANGAFMLFKKECYMSIDGHQAVKDSISEDMDFARIIKQRGFKLYVIQNRDLYRTRMYEDFRSTFTGWSRIFFGCFAKPFRVILAILLLVIMSLLPYFILIGTILLACHRNWYLPHNIWNLVVWSIIAVIAQMSVLLRFYPLSGARWYQAFSYPIGASVTLVMLINALLKFFTGKINWRGRSINIRG